MIAAMVMMLFILGLFFEMLGSRPKSDAEWQNDTDADVLATAQPVEAQLPAARS